MAPSPEEWFKSLGKVTRAAFCVALATTALVSFGLVSPSWIYLDFDLVFRKFQIWRLFTCFCFLGGFGMPFVFQLFILVRHFSLLEGSYYNSARGTAEMIYVLLFGAFFTLSAAYFLGNLFFPGPALVFMVLYIWSRKDPYAEVSFWGFGFKAWHFPFVLLGFGILIGASPVLDIVGILVGHLFYYLEAVVPQMWGVQLIKTPEFLYRLTEQGQIRQPAPFWAQAGGRRMT